MFTVTMEKETEVSLGISAKSIIDKLLIGDTFLMPLGFKHSRARFILLDKRVSVDDSNTLDLDLAKQPSIKMGYDQHKYLIQVSRERENTKEFIMTHDVFGVSCVLTLPSFKVSPRSCFCCVCGGLIPPRSPRLHIKARPRLNSQYFPWERKDQYSAPCFITFHEDADTCLQGYKLIEQFIGEL